MKRMENESVRHFVERLNDVMVGKRYEYKEGNLFLVMAVCSRNRDGKIFVVVRNVYKGYVRLISFNKWSSKTKVDGASMPKAKIYKKDQNDQD
jgi:hypothetical protein